jgi:hypothetical protein
MFAWLDPIRAKELRRASQASDLIPKDVDNISRNVTKFIFTAKIVKFQRNFALKVTLNVVYINNLPLKESIKRQ